ncbi:MAG TPA: tRNA 5-methoxyuridine(34)/uridine 5-oxyacetic acid(34) synthase CmoB [Spirochaetota bacterium]|nr:tRNA 5-methoxyuridine(34)/uridine 5-oxyacetic acid(34) synthase CmoB [Spirochaetota bacterium]HQO40445.1 tRNA 5-methoxyuridine(34)/uridine 5-oxyacetic acid(34) synthase CmoB [Spirochaetota bacterium]
MNGQHDLLISYGYKANEADELIAVCSAKHDYITRSDSKGIKLTATAAPFMKLKAAHTDFTADSVVIGSGDELDGSTQNSLRAALMQMWPWRKGPFTIFGMDIDAEWRSNLKWDRVIPHITPLEHRHVLDIGSSSGYYMFRMVPHRPAVVIGVEPYINFYCQFNLLKRMAGVENIYTLPLRLEELPVSGKKFNTIFCMGILYHRRSPIDFLKQIKNMLSGKGELILETMILEGEGHFTLTPVDRYAMMQNVYFIPTVPVLLSWLKTAGFAHARCVDVTPTTSHEQRRTQWVNTESLADFLDPCDNRKTIEGYQAPVRAVVVANN